VTEEDYDDEEDINVEEEQQKYWKCPKCNELVEMQFDICWNCQSDLPEDIVHPNREEVIKEIRSNAGSFSTMGAGFGAIISGGLIILFDRHRHTTDDDFMRYIFGGFFLLAGVFLILFGIFRKKVGGTQNGE
jgi:RNA polymerase subunit RPABC4/transcription elongation factor Spt4